MALTAWPRSALSAPCWPEAQSALEQPQVTEGTTEDTAGAPATPETAAAPETVETAEEAEEKALTKAAIEGTWWERDDCPSAEPYITDCEEIS